MQALIPAAGEPATRLDSRVAPTMQRRDVRSQTPVPGGGWVNDWAIALRAA
jgi:hypothetical protein